MLAGDIWVNEDSAAPRCVPNVTMQCVGRPRRRFLTSICICTYLVLLSVPVPGTWYLPLFYKPSKKMLFSHTQKSSFGKLVCLQVLVLHPTLLQCYLLLTLPGSSSTTLAESAHIFRHLMPCQRVPHDHPRPCPNW